MPRLRPEDAALSSRAWTWTLSAAAGAALAAFAGLLGRWSAAPALGWTVALAAAGAGAAAASFAAETDEAGARAWAAGGALAALAVPALLRYLGLSLADPALLIDPLGGRTGAVFCLGQAALLSAAAALAWTRALRGQGAGAAALAGAALAALAARRIDPAFVLAGAALAALAAAEVRERPWVGLRSGALRAQAFGGAAALGLALAAAAPNLLPDVWMARLHTAYPGGRFVTLADDGAHLWAAYRFSNGTATLLRDGVPQSPDPATVRLALRAVLGQRGDENGAKGLLLVQPPEPVLALAAQADGTFVTIEAGSPAQAEVFDALGGPGWRDALLKAPAGVALNAALIFLSRPAGVDSRRAGRAALKALRARLSEGASVAVLLPPGASAREADAAARDAAAVFGRARIADLPKGVLVLASPAPIVTDAAALYGNLLTGLLKPDADAVRSMAEGLRWRAAPTEK